MTYHLRPPVEFAIEDIKDITWSFTAFDSLVIAEEKKAIILAMAKARVEHIAKCRFDDVIVGKGQGLNILPQ